MAEPEVIRNAHTVFKWEFTLGHVAQLIAICAGGLGVYYGLVNDVHRNTQDIEFNRKAIQELKNSNQQVLEFIRQDGERREVRIMGHVGEIKENVNWLVRRQAEQTVQR